MEDSTSSGTKTILKTDFDQLLKSCHNSIHDAIGMHSLQSANPASLQKLEAQIETVVTSMIAIGEYSYQQVQKSSAYPLPYAFFSYEWGDFAKAFALLWRDIFFQHQQAWLRLANKEIEAADFKALAEQSLNVLQGAHSDVEDFIKDGPKKLSHPEKQLEKWQLQNNPWPIYKTQLQLIPEQCSKLVYQSNILLEAAQVFESISVLVKEIFEHYLQNLEQVKLTLKKLLHTFKEEDTFSPYQMVTEMEPLHLKLQTLGGLVEFKETLNNLLSKLPKTQQYYTTISDGLLLYKELDLQKHTRTWLESEAMSTIYEFNTIQDQIQNKIGLSIVNIHNRISLDKEVEETDKKDKIEQPLQNFIKSLEKSSQKIELLEQQSNEQFDLQFAISKIYDDAFLPISMQNTINQYRQQQRRSWATVLQWLEKKGSILRQFQKEVKQEEALSLSEKIVRTVRHRTPEANNNHYTNMFLTEGWIGNSFIVGREQELNQIASLIENWRLGFRGDVLITGKRFSGKTLFGEMVNLRFFEGKAIQLLPGKKIQIAGRLLKLEHDLGAALDFVVKNTLNQPMMVWIDDLEYWANDKITLSQNVTKLLATIEQYTDRLFFVVSVSNWLKAHLNRTFEIDRVFQSEINLDQMNLLDVEQAIFIRHSATHMELLNKDQEELSTNQFHQICKRIYRYSEGNIGEALHHWTFMIRKHNNEQLLERTSTNYQLPDFISLDLGILLQSIMMSKRTNEFQLRKLFGPSFKENYKILLQRLINLGILKREGTWLTVNPFLVNDIAKQLEDKLNFHSQNKKKVEKNARL